MSRVLLSLAALGAALALAGCQGESGGASATKLVEDAPPAHDAAGHGGEAAGHSGHDYTPPELSELGGEFQLVDIHGRPFSDADLRGSWSLVYLGYMECQEACPIALASLPAAVQKLSGHGISARTVFIDINAPRLDDMTGGAAHRMAGSPGDSGAHGAGHQSGHSGDHGAKTGPEVRRLALAEWGKELDQEIIILSGTRKQTSTAQRLFQARIESSMLRKEAMGHQLNHTTNVYVLNPEGEVAGLLYHDTAVGEMVAKVRELASAGH